MRVISRAAPRDAGSYDLPVGAEPQGEPGLAADAVVVRQSRLQRDGLFTALLAVFALAFARGFTGAQTAGGRVAVTVFVGVVAALLAWLWIRSVRRPCHLEISGRAITCVGAQDQPITLSRQSGDEFRVVSLGSGRYRSRGLTIPSPSAARRGAGRRSPPSSRSRSMPWASTRRWDCGHARSCSPRQPPGRCGWP
jgi:hypothetical protein